MYIPYILAGLIGLSQAATNDEWASRSIYQVITDRYARSGDDTSSCNITNYCGGSWAGITDKLDYIQDMGFTAIQISPINKNLNSTTIYGQAYHGYWVQDFYTLNDNFGTEDDLKNLVEAVHNRSMYIMVDVVSNEVAYDIGDANMTSDTYIDYSDFNPFNSEDYYNAYCPISDWSNKTQYQDCWLSTEGVATPDLKTENQTVANMLNDWIKEVISNYSFDAIRIDGAKQITYDFLETFTNNASVYAMAEVDDGSASFTCYYQNLTGGLENYPVYYTIIDAFTAGEIQSLVDMIADVRDSCADPQYLTTFIENQDNERFASYTNDTSLVKNAIAFTILADGIPKIYYGQEQHLAGTSSPYNRQPLWENGDYNTSAFLYDHIKTLNKIRNHAISLDSSYVTNSSSILYTDGSVYAARKGVEGSQIVAVLSNSGSSGGAYTLSVPGAADKGTNLTEVIGCTTVVSGSNGTITVSMDEGEPKIFFPTASMNGSGLCDYASNSSATVGASSSSSGTSTSSSSSASSTSWAEHVKVPVWVTLGFAALLSLLMI